MCWLGFGLWGWIASTTDVVSEAGTSSNSERRGGQVMNLGFETMGNATLVITDGAPLLVTDPWLSGHALFGSWALGYPITADQLDSISACKYVWISHGHPDHLHTDSLATLRGKQILLPDHVGGRIHKALLRAGHHVRVLPDRQWTKLSDHVRIVSLADYNQDGVLLIEVGGRLVVDLNDAGDHGAMGFVRRTIRGYEQSFVLALSGWGDADMINFFTEDGHRIDPPALARKRHGPPVGATIARRADRLGATHFVPFSSMHRYQRTDSGWANGCLTSLEDYAIGFSSERSRILPPFIQFDLETNDFLPTTPPPGPHDLREPAEFGDDWSEQLDSSDRALATQYFKDVKHLSSFLDFVNIRVGGRDHHISLRARRFDRGITFEAPRQSLRTALEFEIFDDLLAGNFMKTTLHGMWSPDKLYPDFTPFVGKFADNGGAKTDNEVRHYLDAYRRRGTARLHSQSYEAAEPPRASSQHRSAIQGVCGGAEGAAPRTTALDDAFKIADR